jgi:integrase
MQTAQSVTLVLRLKTPQGWRRYPAAFYKTNGNIKPFVALVPRGPRSSPKARVTKCREEHHPEGTYELRSYQGRDTVYDSLGTNPKEAQEALRRAQKLREAIAIAPEAGIDPALFTPGLIPLSVYQTKLIREKEELGHFEAASMVRVSADEFLKPLRKNITPEEIRRDHLETYVVDLRRAGYQKRTVEDRLAYVKQLLRSTPVQYPKELLKFKAPKSEDKLPEYFTKAERDALSAACQTPRETLFFDLAITLGLRDQELMFLEERDIDYETMTVTVRSKTSEGFEIKDRAERRIPLRTDTADLIKAYVKANPGIRWLTCRPDGKPDTHLLRIIQRLGKRANLKCRVFTHKCRATYCTTLLREGVDIRTVQGLMGHEDLESTIRYLRAIEAEDKALQTKINNINFYD